jgi:hypothetical protein
VLVVEGVCCVESGVFLQDGRAYVTHKDVSDGLACCACFWHCVWVAECMHRQQT